MWHRSTTHGAPVLLYEPVATARSPSVPTDDPGSLTQPSVDRAFRVEQRVSRKAYSLRSHKIVILSGKATARLEVGPISGPGGEAGFVQTSASEAQLVVTRAIGDADLLFVDSFECGDVSGWSTFSGLAP